MILDETSLDLKLLIFDHLELNDLVAIADTNKHFLSLSQVAFARKYSKKTIQINDPYQNPYKRMNSMDKASVVYIHDYTVVLKVLMHFGHLIQKLVVKYSESHSFGPVDINEISKMISLYCSDTLIHLEVDSFQSKFFNNLKRPFTKVQEVSVRGWFYALESLNLDSNELFPAVRRLSLKYIRLSIVKSIEREFKYLEHIHIDVTPEFESEHLKKINIENVLRKNAHIRSFALVSGNWELLNTINQLLPNIENLKLENYNVISRDRPEIIFKKVTNFTYADLQSLPKYLTFQQITEFHFEAHPRNINELIEFVERNSHLTKIFVDKGYFNENSLKFLSTAQLNVTEMNLMLVDVSDQNILHFLRKYEKLRTIQISRNESLEPMVKMLNVEFEDKWIIIAEKFKLMIKCRNEFN